MRGSRKKFHEHGPVPYLNDRVAPGLDQARAAVWRCAARAAVMFYLITYNHRLVTYSYTVQVHKCLFFPHKCAGMGADCRFTLMEGGGGGVSNTTHFKLH